MALVSRMMTCANALATSDLVCRACHAFAGLRPLEQARVRFDVVVRVRCGDRLPRIQDDNRSLRLKAVRDGYSGTAAYDVVMRDIGSSI